MEIVPHYLIKRMCVAGGMYRMHCVALPIIIINMASASVDGS